MPEQRSPQSPQPPVNIIHEAARGAVVGAIVGAGVVTLVVTNAGVPLGPVGEVLFFFVLIAGAFLPAAGPGNGWSPQFSDAAMLAACIAFVVMCTVIGGIGAPVWAVIRHPGRSH